MSHRQGLHSDDSPYPGEPLCYCDEEDKPSTPSNTSFKEQLERILEYFRSEIRSDSLVTDTVRLYEATTALINLLTSEKNKARIDELNRIPVFEVKDTPGNAAQYIIDRLAQLNSLQGE